MIGFPYFKGISIKNKIFATNIVIIIISITSIAIFANLVSQRAIIDKATNNSSRELFLINNNIETLITSVEDYSKMLATDYRLQEVLYQDMLENNPDGELEGLIMRKSISEIISNYIKPNNKVKAASVLTSHMNWVDVGYADNDSARQVFGANPVAMVHENITNPIWTGLVSFQFRYEPSETDVFAVSKAVVHKETGKTIGMVALYVEETEIAAIYESNLNYKDGQYYILDEQGHIISSRDKNLLYRDFTETTSISLPSLDKEEFSFIHGGGNSKMLVSAQHFAPLKWTIISMVPLDEITNEIKEINKLIVRTGFFCIIVTLAISYFLSRSITKPIFQLNKTMRQIRNGQMNVRSTYQSSDEIGNLSAGFNNLMDRIEELVAQNTEEQKTKAEIEFKLLQSQVKPHFLYNTVETIVSLIKLNMRSEAIAAAKFMADFYKISLSKGNDLISVRDEIQLTESYLEIQKLRYVEYMDYAMEIDEDIMRYTIPKLTLQPIIENAIYHGLKRKKERGILQIRGVREHDQIKIEVYDNGVGMDKQEIEKIFSPTVEPHHNKSFGARSVHNRIRMLYGDRYGLQIESVPNRYTKVIIRLPLLEI